MAGQQTVAIVSQPPSQGRGDHFRKSGLSQQSSQGLQGKFVCKSCNTTFPTRYGLQKHKKTHTENYTECPHCNNTYTKRGLKTHITKKHSTRNHIDEIIDDVIARQRDNIVPASNNIDDVIDDVIARQRDNLVPDSKHIDDVIDNVIARQRDNLVPASNNIHDVDNSVIARQRDLSVSAEMPQPGVKDLVAVRVPQQITETLIPTIDWKPANQDFHQLNTQTDKGKSASGLACPVCNQTFTLKTNLTKHRKRYHENNFKCQKCNIRFLTKTELEKHIKKHNQTFSGGRLQEKVQNEPIIMPEGLANELSQEERYILKENWRRIRQFHYRGRVLEIINFRTNKVETDELKEILQKIFQSQNAKFKINLSLGFILQNRVTGEMHYYYPSNNTMFLKEPILVSEETDLKKVEEKFEERDAVEFARQLRPNSEWVFYKLVNLTAYVTKMLAHPIGNEINMPADILDNRAIVALVKSSKKGTPYLDQKCFFRCLALHQGAGLSALEGPANELLAKWTRDPDTFGGVYMEDLRLLEEIFKVNIHVYSLKYKGAFVAEEGDINEALIREYEEEDEDNELAATLVRRPLGDQQSDMYLHLYEGHFSYITDIRLLTHSWRCSKCDKLFNRSTDYHRHELTCEKKIEHKFKGGGIGRFSMVTLLNKIEDLGIPVPKNLKFFPYKIAYDFETLFETCEKENGPKINYEQVLVPASVSVCSDVPGYEEPKCFISEGDPRKMIIDMYSYMLQIADCSYEILRESYRDILDKLASQDGENQKPGIELEKRLKKWLIQIPVCGFNSGKFDFNIMKSYLIPYILSSGEEIEQAIKKENGYMAVSTERLLFLDVSNYLSAGTSYSKWLKSWKVEEQKGWWPYENFTSLEYLNKTQLPPKADFYSDLKQEGISDQDYEYLKQVWVNEGMGTLRDLLVWYNNKDTKPMVAGLNRMGEKFQDMNIDMLKGGCISLPGLAYAHLVKTLPKRISLPLWNNKTKQWHYKLRENICGGPSIIFCRYHEKGKTKIRRVGKTCQKIFGMDANALYLSCLMENMPTFPMAEWVKNDDGTFSRQLAMNLKEYQWVEWMAHTMGDLVRHAYNGGQQKVGKYYVDGYIPKTKTVLQFHGCMYHGHGCEIDKLKDQDRNMKTRMVTDNIKQMGYKVIEKWECEFDKEKRENKEMQGFIRENCELPFKQSPLTPDKLLTYVKTDKFFGLVECSIRVPDYLREKFSEMTPIFKNIEVGREHISETMRQLAEERGYLPKPRRCLIGSYFGEKILLATPLLRWYLEQGLEVTEIFSAMEFKPRKCFEHLGKEVTYHRSKADADPEQAVLGELFKLLGNSYYGKTITDVEKHTDLKFEKIAGASRSANDWRFRKLDEIEGGFYEVQMAKKKIRFNLPELVGFYVYQYAKLKMLDFYYNFLQKYLMWDSFEMMEMDTDSTYFAFAFETLDEGVKPEISKEEWEKAKKQYLVLDKSQKRTPGLFKEEWVGEGMVCLNSKTYFGWGNETKCSQKGLNKRNNRFKKEEWLAVLFEDKIQSGTNKGFRFIDRKMIKYSQIRDGLTSFYPKRKVLEDGVSTVPLDI